MTLILRPGFVRRLKQKEGFGEVPYRDTEGKMTGGYGRNFEAYPITEEEASDWLQKQLEESWLKLIKAKPDVLNLDTSRQEALNEMAYNLGIGGLLGFKKMWAAIEMRNWPTAKKEALDSKWHKQVGNRAKEIADVLLTGSW
jgi:lysozyme